MSYKKSSIQMHGSPLHKFLGMDGKQWANVGLGVGSGVLNAFVPGAGTALNTVGSALIDENMESADAKANNEVSNTLALTQKNLAENKQAAAFAKKGKVLSPINSLIPHNKSASAFYKEGAYQNISGVNSLIGSGPGDQWPPIKPNKPTSNVWNAVDRGNNSGTSSNTVDKGNNYGTVKTMEERSTPISDAAIKQLFKTVGGNQDSWIFNK